MGLGYVLMRLPHKEQRDVINVAMLRDKHSVINTASHHADSAHMQRSISSCRFVCREAFIIRWALSYTRGRSISYPG